MVKTLEHFFQQVSNHYGVPSSWQSFSCIRQAFEPMQYISARFPIHEQKDLLQLHQNSVKSEQLKSVTMASEVCICASLWAYGEGHL